MDYESLENDLRNERNTARPRETAAAFLEDVLAGRRGLRAVRHPLGFLCLPALRSAGLGVCVHLFGEEGVPAASPATSGLHAHSWDLCSHVLFGRVGNLPVRVRDEPESPTHRVFEVHSSPAGLDELRPTERLVRGEEEPGETSTAGQTYLLPAGRFHSSAVPPGEHAATLVLGRTRAGHTDLTLGPLHGGRHSMVRQLCDTSQTVRAVRTALRRIHGDDPAR